MGRSLLLVAMLLASWAGAETTGPGTISIRDESVTQGSVRTLDCSGTGIACAALNGVGTLTVNAGGGSEGNTYTSSKTFTAEVLISSSITFGPSAGIEAGLTNTTMTPCGLMFFTSSHTVVTTATITTVLTTFSTYTVPANAITIPGDNILITCAWQNMGTAPGTPVMGVYEGASGGASTVLGSNASVVNNAYIIQQTRVQYRGLGSAAWVTSEAVSETTAATALVSIAVGTIGQRVFNPAVANSYYCRASRATGGMINFVYMKVAKGCQ